MTYLCSQSRTLLLHKLSQLLEQIFPLFLLPNLVHLLSPAYFTRLLKLASAQLPSTLGSAYEVANVLFRDQKVIFQRQTPQPVDYVFDTLPKPSQCIFCRSFYRYRCLQF